MLAELYRPVPPVALAVELKVAAPFCYSLFELHERAGVFHLFAPAADFEACAIGVTPAARRHEGVDVRFKSCVIYIEVAPDRNAFFEVVRPEVGVESATFIYQGSDFRKGLADGFYFVQPALPFEHRTYKLIAAVYRGVGYDFPIPARRMVVPFDFAGYAARADGVAELPLISVDDFKLDAEAAAENKTALSGERAVGVVFGVDVLDESISDSQEEGDFLSGLALVEEAAHLVRFRKA